MTDTAQEDADRLVDARSVLDGLPTLAAQRRQHRATTRKFAWIALTGLFVVAVFSAQVVLDHAGVDLPALRAPAAVAIALMVSGAALEVVGLVLRRRRGPVRTDTWSPLVNLTRAQRRHILQLVRRDQRAGPEEQDLVAFRATQLAQQGATLSVTLGVVLADDGLALFDDRTGWTFLATLGVVVVLVSGARGLLDIRRGRAWLRSHRGGIPYVPA